ncbi:MAG: hypothetical protein WCY82_11750 [Desulfotomaculaceae bacterium]
MNKIGEIILIAAVCLYVVFGIRLACGTIPPDYPVTPLSATALILTVTGASLKRRARKQV